MRQTKTNTDSETDTGKHETDRGKHETDEGTQSHGQTTRTRSLIYGRQ